MELKDSFQGGNYERKESVRRKETGLCRKGP